MVTVHTKQSQNHSLYHIYHTVFTRYESLVLSQTTTDNLQPVIDVRSNHRRWEPLQSLSSQEQHRNYRQVISYRSVEGYPPSFPERSAFTPSVPSPYQGYPQPPTRGQSTGSWHQQYSSPADLVPSSVAGQYSYPDPYYYHQPTHPWYW